MIDIFEKGLPKFKTALKKEFPNYHFSVTVKNYDNLTIALMKADFEIYCNYIQLNHYRINDLKNENLKKVFTKVDELRRKFMPCEDRSDIMKDYFDVDYYFNYHVGKWNNVYVNTTKADK